MGDLILSAGCAAIIIGAVAAVALTLAGIGAAGAWFLVAAGVGAGAVGAAWRWL